MKLFYFLTLVFFTASESFSADGPAGAAASQAALNQAGLASLENACKLVHSINSLNWRPIDAAALKNKSMLNMVKRDATNKHWLGIGAYRGSAFDEKRALVLHKFAYGPGRTTPHEVWFRYAIDGDVFRLNSFAILGW